MCAAMASEGEGEGGEQEPYTVGTYLGFWLSHTRGRVRPSTYDGYEGLIRLYASPRIGGVLLSELTALFGCRACTPACFQRAAGLPGRS